ncbi:flagellar hook-length control protein FliK [Thiomicrospira pelophila]|uniref:flagellar hook-length control protein FliK n=1 Tax=Thiomicrospira pelophila TaxID=934 RepID=UPI0012DEBB0A|nr:flagellar hook-length control protein FliK [Thiomicrospira pelophila]
MLNNAPDAKAAPSMFGFIHRAETPSLEVSGPGLKSQGDFSMQLGALMMAEYKKGNLDLAALSNLKKVDPQSLQEFAEGLSFDVDLESDESMFEQLSSWLAQQGLATSFTESPLNAKSSAGGESDSFSELDALGNMLNSSLDVESPGLVELSEAVGQVNSDELTPETLSEFKELAEELKASVQTMLEALKSAETTEQKQLALDGFKDSLQKLMAFLKQEKPSVSFDLDTDQGHNLIAEFEAEAASEDSSLLADFIQKHLLPRAQKLVDNLSADQVNLAASNSGELEFSDMSALHTLEELTVLLSSESLQIPNQLNDDLVHIKPMAKAEGNKELINPDLDMNTAENEDSINSILNQAIAFTPASTQATQQAAPQGLTGMVQAAVNRQAQPASPSALADKAQVQAATSDLTSKPLQDTQAPVQTVQQQLSQSNLQQQAMNLNLRDQLAQQQQETLKASDIKYKAADAEGELELLGVQAAGAERKSNAPALASIAYPLRHPQWAQSVGKRIVFMANQQMQQAQISLNPDKLGPIQLRLQLDRDQMVTVSMTAQHGATREALEAAIPRLKEMLEEAGIRFDEVKVEDEEVFEQSSQSQTGESDRVKAAGSSGSGDEDDAESPLSKKQTDNMIDFYA